MSDHDVKELGKHLDGKRMALLITGGIAAYKTPSLVRHFRQYGADVHAYVTPNACDFVAPKTLEWCSKNPVIKKLSSSSEHLEEYDAYVVAPATYNTIGKMASGIADNAVTATLASAMGRFTSVLVAPTMHGTMQNSIERENLEKLVKKGVEVIQPEYGNGKAELPKSHKIVVETIRYLSKSELKGKSMLITAGPTPGWIDNVRYITNRFRGRSGIAIADEAYMRGADVKLILGSSGIKAPKYIDTVVVRSYDEYYSQVMKSLEDNFDYSIFSAAVADYVPKEKRLGKVPSKGELKTIETKETEKVIEIVRKEFPELFMVTFKYEENLSPDKLEEIARNRVNEGYQIVVANRGEEMSDKKHHSIIVNKKGIAAKPSTKSETANALLNILER